MSEQQLSTINPIFVVLWSALSGTLFKDWGIAIIGAKEVVRNVLGPF
jgi:hypothetical protein